MLFVRSLLGPCARVVLLLAVVAATAAGCRDGGFLKQFEYDEDIHLALDGSATIYVNGSLPAIAALRGFELDTNPTARVDRDRIRALFTVPGTRVSRVTSSRQHGRRFAHIRLEVDDIRKLPSNPAFSWATIRFERTGDMYRYREDLGPSPNRPVGSVGWTGQELVAFRLHLPSKIAYHNAGRDNLRRGNILVWEQKLSDRLAGQPLEMEARMEPTSILYRTLWLFLGSVAAALSVLALIIWWVVKKGKDPIV
ncbi:MAG TPA: hypothetical protein VGK32_04265 [Vicinamibacterales bacterium]|jgi:hypothetical protein